MLWLVSFTVSMVAVPGTYRTGRPRRWAEPARVGDRVILCTQYAEIDEALRDWLEAPTDHHRWPWLDSFPQPRPLFTREEAKQPLTEAFKLFHDEIKAIRQTLDFPHETFCGIRRNVLLAMHGQRIRWLVSLLGRKRALLEIAQFT